MFGGPFNRLPYNRPLTLEVLFSITFESETELAAKINLDMPLSVTFDMETEFTPEMTRVIPFSSMFETATEMLSEMTRIRLFGVNFESITELSAASKLYHIDQIQFVGTFAPGDRIIIDSKNLKFTKNGANALHMMQGDFFDLSLGPNNLVYTDPATNRNILIRITHRDKFV
ncbi:phage distal tail protein [Paenibacillus cineris]|uniref:phage distal tail protein n=1 Tax=Paenibacillus cineris TaxID=237530 RepID=UPI001B128393|nr:phage tail family protein [Paenibacillus cineris]GIO63588.1 hypothetical protein J43TS9_51620 [Paenibacillus cineris]